MGNLALKWGKTLFAPPEYAPEYHNYATNLLLKSFEEVSFLGGVGLLLHLYFLLLYSHTGIGYN